MRLAVPSPAKPSAPPGREPRRRRCRDRPCPHGTTPCRLDPDCSALCLDCRHEPSPRRRFSGCCSGGCCDCSCGTPAHSRRLVLCTKPPMSGPLPPRRPQDVVATRGAKLRPSQMACQQYFDEYAVSRAIALVGRERTGAPGFQPGFRAPGGHCRAGPMAARARSRCLNPRIGTRSDNPPAPMPARHSRRTIPSRTPCDAPSP